MRVRQILNVFFTVLFGHFMVFAMVNSAALGQTQPAAAPQKTEATSPELAEADQLSLELIKLYQARKFDEAIPLAKRALKLREKALGANDLLVAEALTNLAEIYLVKGKSDDGEPLLKRALSIYDKNPGGNGVIVGRTLDHLAALRLTNTDVKKAEELYRRAIAVKEKAVGPGHAEVIFSMDGLADLYNGQKAYAKASSILQQVVGLKEKAYGKSHAEVGQSLERLACAMYRDNLKAESEKIEARANQILYSEMAKKPEPLALSPAMFECRIVTNPSVQMPSAAARPGANYVMIVAVDVDESGNVIAANMISGEVMLKKPSEQAARNAKFRPAVVNGRPVKFKGFITHRYSLMLIAVPGTVRQP